MADLVGTREPLSMWSVICIVLMFEDNDRARSIWAGRLAVGGADRVCSIENIILF